MRILHNRRERDMSTPIERTPPRRRSRPKGPLRVALEPTLHTHVPDEARIDPDAAWGDEDRLEMIASNAYYRAERRGFLPGYELADWLEAEREVDAMLRRST
jgi:hypothetical protein